MAYVESPLAGDVQGVILRPLRPTGTGIVVISGSSGRLERARAGLFASQGMVAIAQTWFGGEGQSPGICEIPLEPFSRAIDLLVAEGCQKIAFLGVSKGAEATLLVAAHDQRVDVAIAIAPTSVVWVASGPGRDGYTFWARSSWTLAGEELPFVALDPRWRPRETRRIRYRDWFEKSLHLFEADIPAATIPAERIRGEVVLVAGGDDAIWPSDRFAAAIADRVRRGGRHVHLVTHPKAGHRVIFPGETPNAEPEDRAWGGSEDADRALGDEAWAVLTKLL